MKQISEAAKKDQILYYFKTQWPVLLAVTFSGLIYNLGLLAGPWFEGRMTGCLVDILSGNAGYRDMLVLVSAYVVSIAIVQVSRYVKRFYVRRFANNINKDMKETLYDSLVHRSRAELEEEGGVAARHKRYCENHRILVEGMRALGFKTLLPDEFQSPIITSFLYPKAGFDFNSFYTQLKEKGFVIYPGKISQADTFRIGNIGDVHPEDFARLIEVVQQTSY